MALTPSSIVERNLRQRQQQDPSQQILAEMQNMQATDDPIKNTASNPFSMMSQGLAGISNAFSAPERRAAEQANLDAAEQIRVEQMNYDRGQDTLRRDDALAAQQVEQALAQDKFEATRDYNQGSLDAQQQRIDTADQVRAEEQTRADVVGSGVVGFNVDLFDPNSRDAGLKAINDYVQDLDATGSEKQAVQDQLIKTFAQGQWNEGGSGSNRGGSSGSGNNEVVTGATDAYKVGLDYTNTLQGITQDDVNNLSGFESRGWTVTPASQASLNKFNQVIGKDFMQVYEGLKGGGQITEIEGAKATAARNMLVGTDGQFQKGLPPETIQTALGQLNLVAENEMRVNEYIANNGEEPNLETTLGLLRVGDSQGNPISVGGAPVTEADIKATMSANNLTREQVIQQLTGGAQ